MTDTQQRTLDFIRGYIRENGLSPTIAEIAEGMGWRSPNSAQIHVNALQQKGRLKVKRGANRGIVLTTTSFDCNNLALETAVRIMGIIEKAKCEKELWPDLRLQAAIHTEVINLMIKGVV
ncbi:LexA family transcriptional regulator [Pantoea stewartii subsp. stewartii]|nr:LexA family transcriptional regulator [Pantoea stewartii subsp. stewartii]